MRSGFLKILDLDFSSTPMLSHYHSLAYSHRCASCLCFLRWNIKKNDKTLLNINLSIFAIICWDGLNRVSPLHGLLAVSGWTLLTVGWVGLWPIIDGFPIHDLENPKTIDHRPIHPTMIMLHYKSATTVKKSTCYVKIDKIWVIMTRNSNNHRSQNNSWHQDGRQLWRKRIDNWYAFNLYIYAEPKIREYLFFMKSKSISPRASSHARDLSSGHTGDDIWMSNLILTWSLHVLWVE